MIRRQLQFTRTHWQNVSNTTQFHDNGEENYAGDDNQKVIELPEFCVEKFQRYKTNLMSRFVWTRMR